MFFFPKFETRLYILSITGVSRRVVKKKEDNLEYSENMIGPRRAMEGSRTYIKLVNQNKNLSN